MSSADEFDLVLDQFFSAGPTEIDDAVIEGTLLDIQTIRQWRTGFGPWRTVPMPSQRLALVAAAIVAPLVLLRPFAGVGSGSPQPTGGGPGTPGASASRTPASSGSPAVASRSAAASPAPFAAATVFTSPTYGYAVTLPAGWLAIPAQTGWDGTSPTGFDTPNVDQWVAPHLQNRCTQFFVCAPILWAYSAPTALDLAAWVRAGEAAGRRDHGCEPGTASSIQIDGQPAALEDGHCGAGGPLVLVAYAVRGGIGYAFLLQENAKEARVEGLDRSEFGALLATVRLGP